MCDGHSFWWEGSVKLTTIFVQMAQARHGLDNPKLLMVLKKQVLTVNGCSLLWHEAHVSIESIVKLDTCTVALEVKYARPQFCMIKIPYLKIVDLVKV